MANILEGEVSPLVFSSSWSPILYLDQSWFCPTRSLKLKTLRSSFISQVQQNFCLYIHWLLSGIWWLWSSKLLETFSFGSTYTMSSGKISFIPHWPFSPFFTVVYFLVYSWSVGFPQATPSAFLSSSTALAQWSCMCQHFWL